MDGRAQASQQQGLAVVFTFLALAVRADVGAMRVGVAQFLEEGDAVVFDGGFVEIHVFSGDLIFNEAPRAMNPLLSKSLESITQSENRKVPLLLEIYLYIKNSSDLCPEKSAFAASTYK